MVAMAPPPPTPPRPPTAAALAHGDGLELVFADEFDEPDLDREVWLPHYLPAWSSLTASAATYEVRDSCLVLTIPPQQGLWCSPDHRPPLRVSGVQSGNASGPVGSAAGQQPYRTGLTVREQQAPFWGWTPRGGLLEVRLRGEVTPRSMVSFWLVGLEQVPEQSAEICVVEVFGNAVRPDGSTTVGTGLHAFRDPQVREDFAAVRLPLDVAGFHTYAVDWLPDRVDFLVDGTLVRTCQGPPTYPMQAMVAVFDFPDWSTGDDEEVVPLLAVDWIRCYRR
ncbi:glycosyl hydrolase family 16 [Phycicoccus sp. SLBN-51]|nr:glycosyl hydrolase family 16 [Phycicoccus sp. SLBN-51]